MLPNLPACHESRRPPLERDDSACFMDQVNLVLAYYETYRALAWGAALVVRIMKVSSLEEA